MGEQGGGIDQNLPIGVGVFQVLVVFLTSCTSPQVNCRICLCLESNSCKPADFRQLLQFTYGQIPWALRSSPTQAAWNYHDEMGGNEITKFCFVTPIITCLPTIHVSGHWTTGVCGLCKSSWQASPSLVSVVVGEVITCPLD